MRHEPLDGPWPALPLAPWRATRDALHMWTQIVGKTMLAYCYPQNHWWHSALRVSARGLVTSSPLREGRQALDVEFDLAAHVLAVRSEGRKIEVPLRSRSVHSFYDEYLHVLRSLGIEAHLSTMPVEVPAGVPFDRDDAPREYDAVAAHRFWEVLWRCDAALRDLADGYVGKQSPVHFFWGSFDLASTRFSGRRAPERPELDRVTREAYSHEVISFGFWPGGVTQTGVAVDEPVLYAYAAPEPEGFRRARLAVPGARYDERLGEFVLPYETARVAESPARAIRDFCEGAYAAGAELGGWDRASLERARHADDARGAR